MIAAPDAMSSKMHQSFGDNLAAIGRRRSSLRRSQFNLQSCPFSVGFCEFTHDHLFVLNVYPEGIILPRLPTKTPR